MSVIASEARQSSLFRIELDCHVALLLAMTIQSNVIAL